MPTFNFTYPIPDELYVENWSQGLTGTLVYDGPAEVNLWFDENTRHMHVSDWDLEEGETEPKNANDLIKMTVNAADGDRAITMLWLAKLKGEYATMSEAEFPEEIQEHITGDGKDYMNITNPRPDHLFDMQLDNSEEPTIYLEHILKFPETHAEYECRKRRAKVKFYADEYDLGEEAEAAAVTFLATCDTYMESMENNFQWMYIEQPMSDVPKIPLVVLSAISTVVNAVGDEYEKLRPGLLEWEPINKFWE